MTVILSKAKFSFALTICLIIYIQAFSIKTKSTYLSRERKTNTAPIINNHDTGNIWILYAPEKKKSGIFVLL